MSHLFTSSTLFRFFSEAFSEDWTGRVGDWLPSQADLQLFAWLTLILLPVTLLMKVLQKRASRVRAFSIHRPRQGAWARSRRKPGTPRSKSTHPAPKGDLE